MKISLNELDYLIDLFYRTTYKPLKSKDNALLVKLEKKRLKLRKKQGAKL